MGLRHVLPCCADHSSPLPLPTSVGLLESKRKNSALLYQIPLCFYLAAEIAELEYFKIFAQLATKREGFFGGNGSFILQPDQAPPANDEASRHIEALLMAAS